MVITGKYMKMSIIGVLMVMMGFYSTGCSDLSAQYSLENGHLALRKADRELNNVYRKVLSEYREERMFIRKFRVAQQSWIKYRDAHLASIFPNPYKESEYGTAYSECYAKYKAQLTRARAEQIKVWLDGVEEGEICAGSIRARR